MSLFDSASVVITPSGYKEDKLYSIKPTDGSGDLTVTRATTATRVNSDGLIEVTPYNLLQRSEEFNNAAWTKAATSGGTISVTANYSTAPNGTLTADRLLVTNVVSASVNQSIVSTSGIAYTSSIYLKSNTSSSYTYQLRDGYSGTLKTITVTPQWQRFDLNFTSSGTTLELQLRTLVAGASDISIWGAQLVTGTSAKEYFPTTDRLDVPRLDYTNSSCPSILVEPQRTNIVLRSEEFDNATWSKSGTTISPNTTTSPSGTTTADKIVEVTTASVPRVSPIGTVVTLVPHTITTFAKAAERTQIRIVADSSASKSAYYDLINGTVVNVGTNATASITLYNNGWYRCILTYTPTFIGNGFYIATAENGNTIASGDNTKGVFLWGAQLEAGSNATSYIPTIASTVTRNADVISKTGISSLIGQTEGTIFVDVNYKANNIGKVYLNLGTSTSSYIAISATTLNKIAMEVLNSSVQVNASSTSTYSVNQRLKIAMTYKTNDFKLYVNGILQATDTSGTVPAKAEFYLGSYGNGTFQPTDGINSAILWKTALTDTELAQLTTI